MIGTKKQTLTGILGAGFGGMAGVGNALEAPRDRTSEITAKDVKE